MTKTTTRPILVTGAAGFVGARFVESTIKRGFPVVCVDQLSHFKTRPEHAELFKGPVGPLVDREQLWEWLAARPPLSAIVHLGACTRTTELDHAYLERINTEYSKKLWTYAFENKIPFIYASSAATYGAGEHGYVDNEALFSKLKPLNPYGESKQRFDLWALEQERLGKTPPQWSGFKFFNVYGFGERHKGPMASVVLQGFDQIQKTGRLKLFRSHREGIKDGEQKRDFIYVADVVKVLEFALHAPLSRGIYNLGTGRARSFLDLARATFGALGVAEAIDFIDTPEVLRERYQYFTQAEMQKLKAAGYAEPFTQLEDGVIKTIRALQNA